MILNHSFSNSNDLNVLCVPRTPGSIGERQICEYIEDRVKKLGVLLVRDPFSFRVAQTEGAGIRVNNHVIPASAYPNSLDTGADGKGGRLIYVPRISQAVHMDVEGTIVMTDDPFDERCLSILSDGKAIGTIVHSGLPLLNSQTYEQYMPYEPQSNTITALKISSSDAAYLLSQENKNVFMYYISKVKQISSKNLYALLPGRDNSQELIICAHYDTVPNSPGALDNLSGVIILIKILEGILKIERKTAVRLCWFGAEEFGCAGSKHFISNEGKKNTVWPCIINIDSADCALGYDELYYNSFNKELLNKLIIPHNSIKISEQIYGGDNRSFLDVGVSSITFSRGGSLSRGLMHREYDTLENAGITDESLQGAADRIIKVISSLISI